MMEYVHELSLWGNLLLDHGYELLGQLDSGSFSDVFAVRKMTSDQLMAVKRMVTRREITLDPRVKAEIRCLNELSKQSACVIRLQDTIIKFDRLACLVLELAPLGNLENYIIDHWPLSQELMKAATGQVLSALTHCHRLNIAHRDITPGNVLLMSSHSVRLADFGLAVRCTDSVGRRVKCNDYLGRQAYLAPEVLAEKPYDAIQADMWSMGCLCIFMLSGKHPDCPQISHSFLGRQCVTTKSRPPDKPSFLLTRSRYSLKTTVPAGGSCDNEGRCWFKNEQEEPDSVPCSPTSESGELPSGRTCNIAGDSLQENSEVDSVQWGSITTNLSEDGGLPPVLSAMGYLVSKLRVFKPTERLSSEGALEFWERDT